ncbi:MAG TPA: hypothetical protein VFI65_27955 [Streptosporangiaceae bacterium]|nr:hypothetical protein [Streptosporangiaceae bacterium]
MKIDTTTPKVSLTGVRNGAVYPFGHVPAAACQSTDTVSGVAKAAVLKITTSGAGSFTASCTGAVSVAGAAQAQTVSASYTVDYGFAGFTAPRPGATVSTSSHRITVRFRLDGAAGQAIGNSTGKSLAGRHLVRVSLSGPRIKAVTALCNWDSAGHGFVCTVSRPASRRGPAPATRSPPARC